MKKLRGHAVLASGLVLCLAVNPVAAGGLFTDRVPPRGAISIQTPLSFSYQTIVPYLLCGAQLIQAIEGLGHVHTTFHHLSAGLLPAPHNGSFWVVNLGFLLIGSVLALGNPGRDKPPSNDHRDLWVLLKLVEHFAGPERMTSVVALSDQTRLTAFLRHQITYSRKEIITIGKSARAIMREFFPITSGRDVESKRAEFHREFDQQYAIETQFHSGGPQRAIGQPGLPPMPLMPLEARSQLNEWLQVLQALGPGLGFDFWANAAGIPIDQLFNLLGGHKTRLKRADMESIRHRWVNVLLEAQRELSQLPHHHLMDRPIKLPIEFVSGLEGRSISHLQRLLKSKAQQEQLSGYTWRSGDKEVSPEELTQLLNAPQVFDKNNQLWPARLAIFVKRTPADAYYIIKKEDLPDLQLLNVPLYLARRLGVRLPKHQAETLDLEAIETRRISGGYGTLIPIALLAVSLLHTTPAIAMPHSASNRAILSAQ